MEPLGRDARLLLQLARGSHEPTMAAKTRLRARMDAKLAATAVVGTTGLLGKTTLAHAALPAMKSMLVALPAAKSMLVSLVLVGAVGAGYVVAPVLRPRTATVVLPSAASSRPATPGRMTPGRLKRIATEEPSTRLTPVASSSEVTVEVTAIQPPHTQTRVAAQPLLRSTPVLPQDPAEEHVEAAAPVELREEGAIQPQSNRQSSDPLTEETRLIRQAHQAILKGHPTAALAYLAEHQHQFAFGALQKERDAARIVATCKLSRMQEAQALWERFISAWPNSPLGTRVRASCHWQAER